MINIISWFIIVVFGLFFIISIFGTLASIKNESKNSYVLLGAEFFVLICLFPIKEIFTSSIALKVWQITSVIEVIVSILSILICGKDKTNAIIVFVISILLAILPFYNSVEFSSNYSPIDFYTEKISIRVEALLAILGLISSVILIICTTISIKRLNSLKSNSKLSSLLQQTISALSREESFRSPMDTLWSYEMNSKLRQLETKIQLCVSEIQKLSQKPFLPSNVYSANLDELRPMIYTMSAEISKLNELVSKRDNYGILPNDFTILKELNHTLATPLSQIEVNCELLRKKVKGQTVSQIDKIVQYVNFCRNTITAYKELLSSSTTGECSNYPTMIRESFEMYSTKYQKSGISIKLDAEENINISKNVLMSIISPLLENAVTASPSDSEIKLSVAKNGNWINIKLENECTEVPDISKLKKVGYSSKKDHIGTGLETVRHFLSLLDGKELGIVLNNNVITFTLQFPLK